MRLRFTVFGNRPHRLRRSLQALEQVFLVGRSTCIRFPQTTQWSFIGNRFHVRSLTPKRGHQYTLSCFALIVCRFRSARSRKTVSIFTTERYCVNLPIETVNNCGRRAVKAENNFRFFATA